jgi:hypothetical protein
LASIPEVAAAFFLGMWIKQADLGVLIFILILVFMALAIVGLTGNPSALLPAFLMFGVPYILGYLFGCFIKKIKKEKP